MAKTRYLVIPASDQTDDNGNPYPDIMLNPIQEFIMQDPVENYVMTRQDIIRIDLLMYRKYGYAYYDDIILNLNGIGNVNLIEAGDVISLPSKRDLDNYFSNNLESV